MSSRHFQAFPLQFSASNLGLQNQAPPNNLINGTVAIGGATNFAPIECAGVDLFSIQFTTLTGSTLAGTLTMQASNDPGNAFALNLIPDPSVSNWTTINFFDYGGAAGGQPVVVASKAVVSGPQSIMLYQNAVTFRWVRLVLASVTGSGNVVATFQQKDFQ